MKRGSAQVKCPSPSLSRRFATSTGVAGRGLARKRRLRVAWSSRESKGFKPGEMPPLSGKRAAHEKRGCRGARSRKEKKASGGVVVAGDGRFFNKAKSHRSLENERSVKSALFLQGQVSRGKEGFWWSGRCGGWQVFRQGEITPLFGKRTVREE